MEKVTEPDEAEGCHSSKILRQVRVGREYYCTGTVVLRIVSSQKMEQHGETPQEQVILHAPFD